MFKNIIKKVFSFTSLMIMSEIMMLVSIIGLVFSITPVWITIVISAAFVCSFIGAVWEQTEGKHFIED